MFIIINCKLQSTNYAEHPKIPSGIDKHTAEHAERAVYSTKIPKPT